MLSFAAELLAQSFDVGIHSSCIPFKIISPDTVEELFPGKDLVFVQHEKAQQFKFFMGQYSFRAADGNCMGGELQHYVSGA